LLNQFLSLWLTDSGIAVRESASNALAMEVKLHRDEWCPVLTTAQIGILRDRVERLLGEHSEYEQVVDLVAALSVCFHAGNVLSEDELMASLLKASEIGVHPYRETIQHMLEQLGRKEEHSPPRQVARMRRPSARSQS